MDIIINMYLTNTLIKFDLCHITNKNINSTVDKTLNRVCIIFSFQIGATGRIQTCEGRCRWITNPLLSFTKRRWQNKMVPLRGLEPPRPLAT